MKKSDIPISNPCQAGSENFVKKTKSGKPGRHCALCRKDVTYLSAMTEAEAQRFLKESGKGSCVSYRVRKNGQICFQPESAARLITLRRTRHAGFVLASALAVSSAACGTSENSKQNQEETEQSVDEVAPIKDEKEEVVKRGRVRTTPEEHQTAPEQTQKTNESKHHKDDDTELLTGALDDF